MAVIALLTPLLIRYYNILFVWTYNLWWHVTLLYSDYISTLETHLKLCDCFMFCLLGRAISLLTYLLIFTYYDGRRRDRGGGSIGRDGWNRQGACLERVFPPLWGWGQKIVGIFHWKRCIWGISRVFLKFICLPHGQTFYNLSGLLCGRDRGKGAMKAARSRSPDIRRLVGDRPHRPLWIRSCMILQKLKGLSSVRHVATAAPQNSCLAPTPVPHVHMTVTVSAGSRHM